MKIVGVIALILFKNCASMLLYSSALVLVYLTLNGSRTTHQTFASEEQQMKNNNNDVDDGGSGSGGKGKNQTIRYVVNMSFKWRRDENKTTFTLKPEIRFTCKLRSQMSNEHRSSPNCLVLKREIPMVPECKLICMHNRNWCTIQWMNKSETGERREREERRRVEKTERRKKKLSNTYHLYILIVCLLDLLLVFHWFHVLIFIHWHIIRATFMHTHTHLYTPEWIAVNFFPILKKPNCSAPQWHKTLEIEFTEPISAPNKYTAAFERFQRHM